MVKISFLGDIMCEGPFLNAARKKDGTYDFSSAFMGLRQLLSESDYVIGNLETPLAGEEYGYTNTEELYSFNTPIDFAYAVKGMGVDLVLTANNHCCDRGIHGLEQTLKILDKCALEHTGTYVNGESSPFYTCVKGINIAVISCTASTNAELTKLEPGLENINLLDKQFSKSSVKIGIWPAFKGFIVNRIIGIKNYIKIRKIIGKSPLNPSIDNIIKEERVNRYIDRIREQVNEARRNADFVFLCPHMGGQFNSVPGQFSEYMMHEFAKMNVDAVICSHPHIVQKIEIINHKPCFFSIGNVSMSMGTEYILRKNLPDYGLVIHLYVDKQSVCKCTCSIIKMIEDETGYMRTYLVSDLYENASKDEQKLLQSDVRAVTNLMGAKSLKESSVILREMELSMNFKGKVCNV